MSNAFKVKVVVVVIVRLFFLQKRYVKNNIGQKILDPNKIWVQQILGTKRPGSENLEKKIFLIKKFLVQNLFGPKNIWVRKEKKK